MRTSEAEHQCARDRDVSALPNLVLAIGRMVNHRSLAGNIADGATYSHLLLRDRAAINVDASG
jgi:hypothetical protein